MAVLEFIKSLLTQPAWIMGIISCVGLIALKKPFHKVLVGTLTPIMGYLMLSAGAGVVETNLAPLSEMLQVGFHIEGIVPSNEAVISVAQDILGVETMAILILGYLINLVVARLTRFKYIFLTGHHSLIMACLLCAVLQVSGFSGTGLVVIGGLFLGFLSALLPAVGQRLTLKVTGGERMAMGHFGSLGYYIAGLVGMLVDKMTGSKIKNSAASGAEKKEAEIPEKWSFLWDSMICTGLTMMVFYLVAAIAAGPEFVATLSGDHYIVYALTCALQFSVGVTVVCSGVGLILKELLPAFEGIAAKVIPGAVPAVDCAVFFNYNKTAVLIGFLASFVGGILSMFVIGAITGTYIIPGMAAHFFCGACAGIYGDATGGKKGAVLGAFVHGVLITIGPAMLLPILSSLGFPGTTFGDFDFTVVGILIGNVYNLIGQAGIYGLLAILGVTAFLPNFFVKKGRVIGCPEE